MTAGLAQCQDRLWALVTPPGWASSTSWRSGQDNKMAMHYGGRGGCKGRVRGWGGRDGSGGDYEGVLAVESG
jgi:hypothetical protein